MTSALQLESALTGERGTAWAWLQPWRLGQLVTKCQYENNCLTKVRQAWGAITKCGNATIPVWGTVIYEEESD